MCYCYCSIFNSCSVFVVHPCATLYVRVLLFFCVRIKFHLDEDKISMVFFSFFSFCYCALVVVWMNHQEDEKANVTSMPLKQMRFTYYYTSQLHCCHNFYVLTSHHLPFTVVIVVITSIDFQHSVLISNTVRLNIEILLAINECEKLCQKVFIDPFSELNVDWEMLGNGWLRWFLLICFMIAFL